MACKSKKMLKEEQGVAGALENCRSNGKLQEQWETACYTGAVSNCRSWNWSIALWGGELGKNITKGPLVENSFMWHPKSNKMQ